MDAGMDGSSADSEMVNNSIDTDVDSADAGSTLEAVGYADGETGTRNADRHFDSKSSLLKTGAILAVVSVFVLSAVYYLVSSIVTGFM